MQRIKNIRLRFTAGAREAGRAGNAPPFNLNHPLLSAGEGRQLFAAIRAGDKAAAAKALEVLLACNQEAVYKIAKKYAFSGVPLEDLVQQGNIGLLMAAKRFNPERGTRFLTYAFNWIRNEIIGLVREYGGESKVKRIFITLEEARPSIALVERDPEKEIMAGRVRVIVEHLPENMAAVIGLRYGAGATYEMIGQSMNFSHTRAQQLEAQALAFIRKKMGVRSADLI